MCPKSAQIAKRQIRFISCRVSVSAMTSSAALWMIASNIVTTAEMDFLTSTIKLAWILVVTCTTKLSAHLHRQLRTKRTVWRKRAMMVANTQHRSMMRTSIALRSPILINPVRLLNPMFTLLALFRGLIFTTLANGPAKQ
jgi:hypothetical protein